MKIFITGGCGFLGSNLALKAIQEGNEVFVFDNLYRLGSHENMNWLKGQGEFKMYKGDIRSYNDVEFALKDAKPDVIFHLAGQVAMTTSLNDPRLDFEVNVLGGHNLLECVRKYMPGTIVTYSSTNKVYGDLEDIIYEESAKRYIAKGYSKGFNETLALNFQSPYGCSKGSVDQYMLDYARMFDLRTIVFRHSSIFGTRQFSNYDQGWIGWFVRQYLDAKNGTLLAPFTVSGNGKQVRDVLFVEDLISCYYTSIDQIKRTAGQVYNIGGGMSNSLSLLELFDVLQEKLDICPEMKQIEFRKSDQKVFVADITKANDHFGWKPSISKDEGITRMIEWQKSIS